MTGGRHGHARVLQPAGYAMTPSRLGTVAVDGRKAGELLVRKIQQWHWLPVPAVYPGVSERVVRASDELAAPAKEEEVAI